MLLHSVIGSKKLVPCSHPNKILNQNQSGLAHKCFPALVSWCIEVFQCLVNQQFKIVSGEQLLWAKCGDCVVPEEIHTHPMEGHQKLLGEGGGEAKYEAKLEFLRGRWV